MKNDTLKGQYRINEQIRAKEVRIVSDDIEPKVYPIFQALKMAEEKELDLVEISPNAQPPVCRIIDYSKFPVSYTHLRAHETRHDLVCRLLLEKKNTSITNSE